MHRLLYSAAPLLAGSLAMCTALASSLSEFCDSTTVHTAGGDSANEVRRCPFCRTPAPALPGGDDMHQHLPLHPPLWHRAIPAGATYPRQAMTDPAMHAALDAERMKVCLTCHDDVIAGISAAAGAMSGTGSNERSMPGNDRAPQDRPPNEAGSSKKYPLRSNE